MAVETEVLPSAVERVHEKGVSWGAIFGGTIVALGVWAMVYSLGLALGLSAIDPHENIRGSALFTGIWSIISPLVALFVGGWVAGRTSGVFDRTAGMLHGAVLWGLTALLGAFLLTSLVGRIVGTVANVGGAAVSAGAGAVGGGGLQALGIDANQLLGPVNQRLQEAGKPQITAQQLGTALQSSIRTSLQQGRFDAQTFRTSLAQNTNLSEQDVQEIAGGIETRLSQGVGTLETAAANVASSLGTAFWGVFFALLLGLVSACLGAATGIAGVRKREERHAGFRVPRKAEVP